MLIAVRTKEEATKKQEDACASVNYQEQCNVGQSMLDEDADAIAT